MRYGLVGCFGVVISTTSCASEPPPPPVTYVAPSSSATTPPVVASTSAPVTPPSNPPPTPKAACIPSKAVSGPLSSFTKGPTLFYLCVGEDTSSPGTCVGLDPKTSSWSASELPKPIDDKTISSAPPKFTLATDGTNAKVCPGGQSATGCKIVKPGFKPRANDHEGAVSGDGKTLFLYRYVPSPKKSDIIAQHKLFGEIFDVATGKKSASFALPVGTDTKPDMYADQSDIWSGKWYGAHLVLSAYRCCGPAGLQAFVNTKSGKLRRIGDPALVEQLGDDTFLIGNEERSHDADGKIKGSLSLDVLDVKADTSKRLPLPGKSRDEPETFVIGALRLDDGTYAVAYANPPGIVMFDPKAQSLGAPKPAPICP